MEKTDQIKIIWSIGHSTRSLKDFVELLNSFDITQVADIRSYPGSRRYPQFNKEALEVSLPAAGIQYSHLPDLGGRRKAQPDSVNTIWRNLAFRGYADYMETDEFKTAIAELELLALTQLTAFMCSEALWWRCHRSLVSDYLKLHGWTVIHIMGNGKGHEHPFTKPVQALQCH